MTEATRVAARLATQAPSPPLTPRERRLLVGVATGEGGLSDAAFASLWSRDLVAHGTASVATVISARGVNALVWTKRARVATMRAMLGKSPSLVQGDHFEPAVTRAARQLDRAWKAMGCCQPHSPAWPPILHRADQHCPCPDCGWPYRLHPQDWGELTELGRTEPGPFLHVACDGRRVKL